MRSRRPCQTVPRNKPSNHAYVRSIGASARCLNRSLGYLRAVQVTKDARNISDVMLPGMVMSTRFLLRCMTGGSRRVGTWIRPRGDHQKEVTAGYPAPTSGYHIFHHPCADQD